MERIEALINKLYQLKNSGCAPAQLLPTVQLLYSEILSSQQQNASVAKAKVAVSMPVNLSFVAAAADENNWKQEKVAEKIPFSPMPEVAPVAEPKQAKVFAPKAYALSKPEPDEVLQTEAPSTKDTPAPFFAAFNYEPQAPTLAQHQVKEMPTTKEINQLAGAESVSLNDRLKQESREVAHSLKETPIKDLKKGIGINERFSFVSELFRGDDAMYERSIKTINSFGILSEAEYWINRELKFKLGWNDQKEEVQHFYRLVRRRFS